MSISLRFAVVRRSSCGSTARWILARTSSLVAWSLYEMHSIFQWHFISMACILLRSSAVRVHDSQACRKMDVTRKRISRILELREIFPSFQTGFNPVSAAVVCDILQSISGLERSSIRAEPRQLVTFSRFCPFTLMTVMTVYRARIYPCWNSMLIALERPQSSS